MRRQGSGDRQLRATIVIPFHRDLGQLRQSLRAARQSQPDAEIIIAADGARDDCHPLGQEWNASVITIDGPAGPAVARNRAAARAQGDVLVFVDADVVVAPDAIAGMCRLLDTTPDVAAVFGAYDLTPRESNFMSQFRNLLHSYVHEVGDPDASTFWAGLGAIRADAFRTVGGFDERFATPSVEDIDLGYRLVAAGRRIRLDARFRGTHLKRWTLRRCIVTDIGARGVPWTQLIHRQGGLANDLNTRHTLRLSVVAAYGLVAALAGAIVWPWTGAVAIAMLGVLVWLNLPCYRWFARHRGVLFAATVVPAHVVHHLCNGLSFAAGTIIHAASGRGIRLPGALPETSWSAASSAATRAGT